MKMITLNFGQRSVVLTGGNEELVRKILAAVKVARIRGESIPEEVDCDIDELEDFVEAIPSTRQGDDSVSFEDEGEDDDEDYGFVAQAVAVVKKNSSGGEE